MTARPMREARVDLAAIAHNVGTLSRVVGTPHVMVVVKAGGYGHGAVAVAGAALEGGADWLGVADIREALELRAAGITAPVLAWLHDPRASFDEAIAAGIDLGVSYPEQLERVAHAAGPAFVHLKVDTGLGRNGASDSEWPQFFAAAAAHERAGRLRVRGLWSHLANAGAAEDLLQVEAFERAIALARESGLDPQLLHLASTAGALRVPSARFDLVRLGIGAYGLSPFDDASSADLGLRPALELSATIASVKRVPEGSGVSYGYDHRTAAAATLALVPLGYGDGIPRHASSRGPVSINGRTYRVAGRVAMDQFVVDVGDDPVSVGDRAVLFGDPSAGVPSADDWAAAADTINYEIVTRLGARIERTHRRCG
ncbi:alanine racemase [Lacisediminihabitans sp.]|jgi:alanine racemase|uniref:alanine racemase n=1 Tax=Lacisediminihabitans sp. TaxID=2787631 RepID=UPI002F939242